MTPHAASGRWVAKLYTVHHMVLTLVIMCPSSLQSPSIHQPPSSNLKVNQNLIRCLLIEAPPPEEKLAMLSEIAQEHAVEWDASAAARELLPHPTPMAPLAPPMGSGSGAVAYVGGFTPPLPQQYAAAPPPHGFPPHPPSQQYTNANQAAAAAAHAAMQAEAAASFAAQFAMHQSGVPVPPPPATAHASFAPPGVSAPPAPPALHPSSGSGGGSSLSEGGVAQPHFVERSEEEIQRVRD